MNNRRKPMHNNGGGRHHNNNQNRGRHGGGNNNNRGPRKNYPQLREKYMNQARDALSAGDRVMAEYYFQHADHCYRMMMEDGYRPRQQHEQGQQEGAENAQPQEGAENSSEAPMQSADEMIESAAGLPAFLTMGAPAAPAATPPVQDWEERDAG